MQGVRGSAVSSSSAVWGGAQAEYGFGAFKPYKKLSYCWETVRRESMPRIAEMDVEMTT